MLLVHRGKHNPGKWEVAWTWLPYFLAADQLLHRHVDKAMTARWKGVENPGLSEVRKMHMMVIDLILERYPIQGLGTYLQASMAVTVSDDGAVPIPSDVLKSNEAKIQETLKINITEAIEANSMKTVDPALFEVTSMGCMVKEEPCAVCGWTRGSEKPHEKHGGDAA